MAVEVQRMGHMDFYQMSHAKCKWRKRMKTKKVYSTWFLVPAMVVFGVFFLIPVVISFYFSMYNWTFTEMSWCGLKNYELFIRSACYLSDQRNTDKELFEKCYFFPKYCVKYGGGNRF